MSELTEQEKRMWGRGGEDPGASQKAAVADLSRAFSDRQRFERIEATRETMRQMCNAGVAVIVALLPPSTERERAVQALREARMWADEAIALHG